MVIRYKMYKMTSSNKKRLDIILVEKGLIETRSKANEVIKAGRVKVNNDIIQKSGTLVDSNSVIEIESGAFPYVSRSGEKLESALKKFQIDVRNKICLDIGASTGGFTDCLLKNGAKLVYAVDVGKNQLHPSLKNSNLVISYEETDIRDFSLPNKTQVDFVCVDVSFISVMLILPLLKKFLSPNGEAIILIKPQFEVGKKNLNKRGIVKNPQAVKDAIKNILKLINELGFSVQGIIESPLKGKGGNREYLLYLKNTPSKIKHTEQFTSNI